MSIYSLKRKRFFDALIHLQSEILLGILGITLKNSDVSAKTPLFFILLKKKLRQNRNNFL